MATAEISATAGTVKATAQMAAAIASSGALASAADTDVGTVVTDLTTAFTDLDTAAAAIIAITGDTYVAHQFVFGGTTELTHAQWATVGALLNTAITAFLTAQTDTTAAKAATVAAKGGTAPTADVSVYIGSTTNVSSLDIFDDCMRRIRQVLAGTGLLKAGQGNPRSLS